MTSSVSGKCAPTIGRDMRGGFTLVELLVVIAIIASLVGLLIPAVQAARGAARKTSCSNNLRQVGLGLANYEAARQKYPAGQIKLSRTLPFTYSWAAEILAFLEEQGIADQLNLEEPFLEPQNLAAASQVIPAYLCPATALREEHRNAEERLVGIEGGAGNGLACTDYIGISGPSKTWKNPVTDEEYGPQRGVLIGVKGLPREATRLVPPAIRPRNITDGLSHTTCVTECSGRGLDKDGDVHGAWVSGKNIGHVSKGINADEPPKAWHKERIYSQHSGGAQFLFCDGSIRFINEGVEKVVLKAICSRNGEETIDLAP